MDANFDADLEELEQGACTAQPRDELESFHLFRGEREEGGIRDGL